MNAFGKYIKGMGSLRQALLLITAAAIFTVCCGKGKDNPEGSDSNNDSTATADSSADSTATADTSSSDKDKKELTFVPVEISSVELGEVYDYILQNATVDTEEGVDVHARVAGLVVKLNVEEGDWVAGGTVLCVLEDDDYRLARDKSKVNYDKLGADFRRLQDMHDKQLTSTMDFEEARFNFEQARIDWETAELNFRRTRINASIAGVVTNRYVHLGELVGTTKPLFRIVDTKENIAVIHAPEREIGSIRQRQKAFLTTDNFPGRRFAAVVKRISPTVDASSGTFRVTVGLKDLEEELRPGMFVAVHIITDTHENALLIPKSSVVYENGLPYAFFLEQDTLVRRVRLEKGFSDEQYVEVLSSVSDTDRVVVVGQNGLKDGARIKVVAGLLEEPERAAADSVGIEEKL